MLASFLSLVACQSEQDGYAALCQSVETCVACRGLPGEIAMMALWQHIDANVKNGTVRDTVEQMVASADPSDALRELASEAGVHPCALADHLDDEAGMYRAWGSPVPEPEPVE